MRSSCVAYLYDDVIADYLRDCMSACAFAATFHSIKSYCRRGSPPSPNAYPRRPDILAERGELPIVYNSNTENNSTSPTDDDVGVLVRRRIVSGVAEHHQQRVPSTGSDATVATPTSVSSPTGARQCCGWSIASVLLGCTFRDFEECIA